MKKGNRIFFIAILSILLISVFANLASSAYDPVLSKDSQTNSADAQAKSWIEDKGSGLKTFFVGNSKEEGYFENTWNGLVKSYKKGGTIGAAFYFFETALGTLPIIGPVMNNPGFEWNKVVMILFCIFLARVFMVLSGKIKVGFVMKSLIGPIPIALFRFYELSAVTIFVGFYLLATLPPVTDSSIIINIIGLCLRALFGLFFLFPIFQPWDIFTRIVLLFIIWFFSFKLIKKVPIIGSFIYEYFEFKVLQWEKRRIKKLAEKDAGRAQAAVDYWNEMGKALKL